MIGSDTYYAITCVVLEAGSSSWHEFFWSLLPEAFVLPFTEKSVQKNIEAFKMLGYRGIVEIWNVRSEFFKH